jgi:hypothetical protein
VPPDLLGRLVAVGGLGGALVARALAEAEAGGAGEAFIEAMVGMPVGLRDRRPADERSILTTTPTTLASWAHEHLRG